jgi:hypothetical protein
MLFLLRSIEGERLSGDCGTTNPPLRHHPVLSREPARPCLSDALAAAFVD